MRGDQFVDRGGLRLEVVAGERRDVGLGQRECGARRGGEKDRERQQERRAASSYGSRK
ncbi:hypothetical protein QFZ98_007634 [Paraburkholderia youngii]